MSHVTRPKPTYMLVCDLCDEEIDPYEEGGLSRGNVIARVTPIKQVTESTRHALICWPRKRVETGDPELDQGVGYDFHGKCIVALVKREVETRTPSATEGE